jgi:hypothetical protein
MSELTAASQNGNGKTTVLVNGTQTQPNANFSDSPCSTWTSSNSGNTSTVTYHPCHAISFTLYNSTGLAAGTGIASTDYITMPIACSLKAYNLAIDGGTITVKFWKIATGTAIPTNTNSINTSGVAISTGTAIHSTTLTDFTTTTISANDILAMNITAVSTANFVNGVLFCQE